MVPVEMARTYEREARDSGKAVQSYYYEGGEHVMFISREYKSDLVRRSVAFLNQYLRP